MTSIAVLGSGIMASALTVPLADNGHDVRLVGSHLDREIIDALRATGVHPGLDVELAGSVRPFHLEEAEAAFDGAQVVMSGVNSFGVRWAGEQLAGLVKPDQTVITITKGMDATEAGDLRILPEVLVETWPAELRDAVSVSAIVGPSIAGELAVRHDTCVVFAGPDQGTLDFLAETFRTAYYHIWTSTDLVGSEVCAALKNCYALGVGCAEGVLEAHGQQDGAYRMHNYEAALFAQGMNEMRQMVDLLGGHYDEVIALPAVGDCYVTSAGGRNVRVGRLIGTGMGFTEAWEALGKITLEGAAAIRVIGAALPKLTERGVVAAEDYPLLRHLYDVVGLEQPLDLPWGRFFGGEPGTAPAAPAPTNTRTADPELAAE